MTGQSCYVSAISTDRRYAVRSDDVIGDMCTFLDIAGCVTYERAAAVVMVVRWRDGSGYSPLLLPEFKSVTVH